MPDETITEEQEQVAQLFTRYELYCSKWSCAYLPLLAFSFVMYFHLCEMYNPLVIMFLFIGIWGVVPHLLYRYTAARFARLLSEEERKMIEPPGYVFAEQREQDTFDHLMKASAKITPRTEYLRASAKPEDNTLLRAAQYTDEKAQDQLLRPADNDEK